MSDVDPNADLLTRQGQTLRRLARSLVDASQDPDDVVQDAVVAAWRQGIDDSGPWLNVVTRRLALLGRRRHQRRLAREATAAEMRPSHQDPTDVIVASAEAARRVAAAVERLDEPFKTAVVLRFWHDLPPRKIAQQLDVPVATVRSRIQRGLARLRHQLDDAHGGRRAAWAVPLTQLAWPKPAAAAAGGWIVGTAVKITGAIAAAATLAVLFWPTNEEPETAGTQTATARDSASSAADPAQPAERRRTVEEPVKTPELTVTGRLIDEATGQPVIGGFVDLEGAASQRAETDAAGRFELPLATVPQRSVLTLWTEASGYARERHARSVDDAEARCLDLGDVQMVPGTELTGTVVDDQGVPVADADVFASTYALAFGGMHGSAVLSNALRIGRTDRSGWFRSQHRLIPYSTEMFVVASTPNALDWTPVELTRHRSAREVTIQLTRQAAPTVLVRDPRGQPIPGADVIALPRFAPLGHERIASAQDLGRDLDLADRFVASSDPAGAARFEGLPRGAGRDWGAEGSYRLKVTAAGFWESRIDVELAPGDSTHHVTLIPDTAFAIDVTCRDPSGPVPDVEVQLAGQSAITNAAGIAHFEHVSTTKAKLHYRITAPDHVDLSGSWPLPRATAEVQLQPATQYAGRVVDQLGDPVEGARVFVDRGLRATSNASGDFTIDELPTAAVRLTVLPPDPASDWEPVTPKEPLAVAEWPKRFVLTRRTAGLATLSVEVVDMATGRPASPNPASLYEVDERDLRMSAGIRPAAARIGKLEFTGVRPGRYQLQVGPATRTVLVPEDARQVPIRIEVGSKGRIEGDLLLAEGATWPETVRLTIGPDSNAGTWTEPRGGRLLTQQPNDMVWAAELTPTVETRFALEAADPHRTLRLSASGGGLFGTITFRVPSGGVARPRIELSPAGTLRLGFEPGCPWHRFTVETRRRDSSWHPLSELTWMQGRKRADLQVQAGTFEWRILVDGSIVHDGGSATLAAGQSIAATIPPPR